MWILESLIFLNSMIVLLVKSFYQVKTRKKLRVVCLESKSHVIGWSHNTFTNAKPNAKSLMLMKQGQILVKSRRIWWKRKRQHARLISKHVSIVTLKQTQQRRRNALESCSTQLITIKAQNSINVVHNGKSTIQMAMLTISWSNKPTSLLSF